MQKVLRSGPSAKHSGIAVLPRSSAPNASGNSVNVVDIDAAALPDLDTTDLPLPLDDPRRIYNSSLPSVKLTHPGGWLEGGGGPENGDHLAQEFMRLHNFRTQAALQKFIRDETRRQFVELKSRMQVRQETVEQNERVAKEIQQLEAQREMERKLEARMRQEAKKRRESV